MIKPQMSTATPHLDLAAITARITELTVLAVHEHIQLLGRTQAQTLIERIHRDGMNQTNEPNIDRR